MEWNLAQYNETCSCGRSHSLLVKEIIMETGALSRIPELIRNESFAKPVMICDTNTYRAAGQTVSESLEGMPAVILPAEGLHADEHGVELAAKTLPEGCDLLLAVGSGTIHDIVRYIAYENDLPFFSVPTAASVDGFVSTVAAMTMQGLKKSFTAVSPLCVIADTAVFSKAPVRLNASGAADLLGKYTALADWRISHLVSGEYICERICRMEEEALSQVTECLDGVRQGEEKACETLMHGLLLSGLAMQMTGNSRPASGAEHHLSHLWEIGLICPESPAYHGEKVGVGLRLLADIYHEAADRIENRAVVLGEPVLECPKVLVDENGSEMLLELDLQSVSGKLGGIAAILRTIPTAGQIEGWLQAAGAPVSMEEIKVPVKHRSESLRLSPYVRRRLTMMRLLKLFDCYEELIR